MPSGSRRSPVLLVAALIACSGHVAADKRDLREVSIRCFDVVVRDGLAYTAQTTALVVLDVADPLRPERIALLPIPSTVASVALDGDTAYLAAGSRGVLAVDIADPEQPELLWRFDTPASTRQVALGPGRIYAADGSGGLLVIDRRIPDRPRRIESHGSRNQVRGLHLNGKLLATAEGTAGARLFDVLDDGKLRERARLDESTGAVDVHVGDDAVLVATGKRGLRVYPIRKGNRLFASTVVPPLGSVQRVSQQGRLAFLANGGDGIQFVDLTDLEAPRTLAVRRLPRSYPVGRMWFDGGMLYAAADIAGVAILDLEDPSDPQVVTPRVRPMQIRGLRGEGEDDGR